MTLTDFGASVQVETAASGDTARDGGHGDEGMSERTERHTVAPKHRLAGEGHEGMPRVGTA